MSEPLNWRDSRLAEIPLIHLSDGPGSTGIVCTEAEAGLLPRYPTVVVGQQYLLHPTRVPAGPAALWLQLQEVPYAPVATRPENSTLRTAGPRRWPKVMPAGCWTGSLGTPPICATKSAASIF